MIEYRRSVGLLITNVASARKMAHTGFHFGRGEGGEIEGEETQEGGRNPRRGKKRSVQSGATFLHYQSLKGLTPSSLSFPFLAGKETLGRSGLERLSVGRPNTA
jgi:hypothetical protein